MHPPLALTVAAILSGVSSQRTDTRNGVGYLPMPLDGMSDGAPGSDLVVVERVAGGATEARRARAVRRSADQLASAMQRGDL